MKSLTEKSQFYETKLRKELNVIVHNKTMTLLGQLFAREKESASVQLKLKEKQVELLSVQVHQQETSLEAKAQWLTFTEVK